MKHSIISHKKLISCTLVLIFTSWNGSMIDTSNNKRPDVNFYGELTDNNSTCKVEDILIGGKYEDIYVYEPIKNAKTALEKLKDTGTALKEEDPTANKIKLNLQDVTSIELTHPDHPIEHELVINNRKYTKIEVTSITGNKETYLIESSREISCLKIDKGPEQDQQPVTNGRKINMINVKKLLIKGYKGAQDKAKPHYSDAHQSEKAEIANSTEKILDQIEEKVNNLPKEDSNYDKLKHSLLSLLRSLRDQLQKMLSLIKN